jgi:polar amino acid transport system substrate-binding protein
VVRKAAREQRQVQASQWIAEERLIADLRKRSEVSDQQGRVAMKTVVAGLFEHDLFRKPLHTPDQVRGRLFGIMLRTLASRILIAVLLSLPLVLSAAAREDDVKELAPTGKLRVALVFAPEKSIFFVVKDGNGRPQGVTADIAGALGNASNLPVEYVLFPNSGLATDALESGAVDVSFMPVDAERKQRVAFGPNYVLGESTYMVTAALPARTVEEVDRPGVRVIGIANTTTIRAAARTLKNTAISPVPSVAEAVAMLRDGKADAFALSRDSLPTYVKQVPGSRITDGAFQQIGIAIAVAKGNQAGLAAVTKFMDQGKSNGLVRKALNDAGYPAIAVAP